GRGLDRQAVLDRLDAAGLAGDASGALDVLRLVGAAVQGDDAVVRVDVDLHRLDVSIGDQRGLDGGGDGAVLERVAGLGQRLAGRRARLDRRCRLLERAVDAAHDGARVRARR